MNPSIAKLRDLLNGHDAAALAAHFSPSYRSQLSVGVDRRAEAAADGPDPDGSAEGGAVGGVLVPVGGHVSRPGDQIVDDDVGAAGTSDVGSGWQTL